MVDDEKMEELVESIKESGVLTPVLVRPDDEGTYEMISGHRRLHAAKIAGLRKIPAVIKETLRNLSEAHVRLENQFMEHNGMSCIPYWISFWGIKQPGLSLTRQPMNKDKYGK